MRNRCQTAGVLFLCTVLLLTPVNIFSCGPFFTEAIFVPKVRPAPTIDPYLAGHLGVVQPTYYRVYLAIAYRVLAGKPFDPAQLGSAKLYWTYDQAVNKEGGASVDLWNKARASALGEKEKLGPNPRFEFESLYRRELNGYNSYRNCTPDAFRNAALTLGERARQFGTGSATIRDWIVAQDGVFSNCTKNDLLPIPAAANADASIKADRNYQIAAAHFYREEFDQARAQFLQIAQDRTSPWRTLAPYLAARALIRKATLSAPEDKPADPTLLAQAQAELEQILADKKSAQIHAAADSTLGFVEFRLDPTQRLHQLAQRVSGQRRSPNLGQDMIDYTRLLDKVVYGPGSAEPGQPPTLQDARADDITDWIFNARSSTPETRNHAVTKWQQTQSMPWLIMALVQTYADAPDLDQLLSAAAAIPQGSAAYDSATYHRARLLLLSRRTDEARAIADRELQRAPEAPNATRNLYLGLRWQLARNLDEFLKFAPQVPVTYQDTSGYFGQIYCANGDDCTEQTQQKLKDDATLFEPPVAAILNQRMPLALLAQAAQSSLLPPNLRDALLVSTWTRATILQDSNTVQTLGQELGQRVPALQSYVASYAAADRRPSSGSSLPCSPSCTSPGCGPMSTVECFAKRLWQRSMITATTGGAKTSGGWSASRISRRGAGPGAVGVETILLHRAHRPQPWAPHRP